MTKLACQYHAGFTQVAEGIPYQPHGHPNQVNSNLDSWHMDVGGDCDSGRSPTPT